jgi:hypothetical protein
MLRFFLIQTLSFITLPALAQTTPVSLWQSVGEATSKPRAEIRISEASGVLSGRIERRRLPVPRGAEVLCLLCPDHREDKPFIGMERISPMKLGSEAQTWEGGEILDPDKGKICKLQLQLQRQDGDKEMQVRGYLGLFFSNHTSVSLS